MTATQAIFLCNRNNTFCDKSCLDHDDYECKHTVHSEYALNPDSVELYNEFIKRFKVSSMKIDEDNNYAIIFEERG